MIAPNRLAQVGPITASDQAWQAHITYLSIRAGWLYPAVVIDSHRKRVRGWTFSPSPETGPVYRHDFHDSDCNFRRRHSSIGYLLAINFENPKTGFPPASHDGHFSRVMPWCPHLSRTVFCVFCCPRAVLPWPIRD